MRDPCTLYIIGIQLCVLDIQHRTKLSNFPTLNVFMSKYIVEPISSDFLFFGIWTLIRELTV